MDIQAMAFLSRHVCWQPQSNTLSLAVPEWIHGAKNSVEHLDPAPWKYMPESLDLAQNLFTMSHKVYNPQFSTVHFHFCRLSPYSKRSRAWRTNICLPPKSRGKPLDR